MKRKEVNGGDFSDFSLCSPATKIRRLDAELPPVFEEEEIAEEGRQQQWEWSAGVADGFEGKQRKSGVVIEELVTDTSGGVNNEERALVLFKPVHCHLPAFSSSSYSVDPDIMAGFKNRNPWSSQSGYTKSAEEDARIRNEAPECMALVPWVPSEFPHVQQHSNSQTEMEAEEMGEAAMDVEEGYPDCFEQGRGGDNNLSPQWWQQQHCLIPQLPQNTSTPIT